MSASRRSGAAERAYPANRTEARAGARWCWCGAGAPDGRLRGVVWRPRACGGRPAVVRACRHVVRVRCRVALQRPERQSARLLGSWADRAPLVARPRGRWRKSERREALAHTAPRRADGRQPHGRQLDRMVERDGASSWCSRIDLLASADGTPATARSAAPKLSWASTMEPRSARGPFRVCGDTPPLFNIYARAYMGVAL